jgi:cobalt/nickel transport system permease protein
VARIESAMMNLGSLNELAGRDTVIHRLDPRAKLLTTLAFIVAVVSFNRYALVPLLPFFLFPVALMALADLPFGQIAKRLLLAAPFAVFVGIFNPIFDQDILVEIGPISLSGGWISFFSIMIRFGLAVSAALILIATTGIEAVCGALIRLKAPRVFVVQILLMYRYLFVLIEEAARMLRAHSLRTFKGSGMRIKTYGSLIGQLLLRTLDRAQTIHMAMLSRGFDGEIRLIRDRSAGVKDVLFFLGWCGLFFLFRLCDVTGWIGRLLLEAGS